MKEEIGLLPPPLWPHGTDAFKLNLYTLQYFILFSYFTDNI
jgi:hypothetical protein